MAETLMENLEVNFQRALLDEGLPYSDGIRTAFRKAMVGVDDMIILNIGLERLRERLEDTVRLIERVEGEVDSRCNLDGE